MPFRKHLRATVILFSVFPIGLFSFFLLGIPIGPFRGPLHAQDKNDVVKEPVADNGLLQPGDLEYLGAFRLPATTEKYASRFPYGGHAMAFNPSGDEGKGSLFIAGHSHHQLVAEVSLAEPRKKREIAGLETARFLQPFADVTGGLKSSFENRQMLLGGLLVHDKTILWSIFKWYNVDGESLPSHGASNLTLNQADAKGLWKIGTYHCQRTAGFMCDIPESWQKQFGFPFLTGVSRMTGRATSSDGPDAFGFNPWEQTSLPKNGSALRSKEFLCYDIQHPSTYTVEGVTHKWKGANGVTGMAFPLSGDEKRSAVVFFVRVGLHSTDWYGDPANFPGNADTCGGGSGYHAPPYRAMAWFYDPNDLLKVGRGQAVPWSVKPFAVKDLSDNFYQRCVRLGAVGYDAKQKRFYLIEQNVDAKNQWESWPVVHVYGVK